jgi:hypothetical protein
MEIMAIMVGVIVVLVMILCVMVACQQLNCLSCFGSGGHPQCGGSVAGWLLLQS